MAGDECYLKEWVLATVHGAAGTIMIVAILLHFRTPGRGHDEIFLVCVSETILHVSHGQSWGVQAVVGA